MDKIYENDRVRLRPELRGDLTPDQYTGTTGEGERIEGVWCFRVKFDDGGEDSASENELELVHPV